MLKRLSPGGLQGPCESRHIRGSNQCRLLISTLAVLVAQDGVILGADTRATDDMVVADKNCIKIHYIAPKI